MGACPGTGLVMGSDGITLDCAGHSIVGSRPNSPLGIDVTGRNDIIVRNCVLSRFNWGISVFDSTNSTVEGNTATGNLIGFVVQASPWVNLVYNQAYQNTYGGFQLNSDHDLLRGNVAFNNPAGFQIYGRGGMNLTRNIAFNDGLGFNIASWVNILDRNDASFNQYAGFYLNAVSNNTLVSNTASNNGGNGYSVYGGIFNSFTGNSADNNRNYGFSDETSGPGTAGTFNIYLLNTCSYNVPGGSNPVGLCTDTSGHGGSLSARRFIN